MLRTIKKEMGRRDRGTDGWHAGGMDGCDAGGRGGRAGPKPYALWNTCSPAFKVWKCRCWVRDHPNGILMASLEHPGITRRDLEGMYNAYERF